MAPYSSTVARKIPWMEEPGGLQSMGSHRVGHDLSDVAAAAGLRCCFRAFSSRGEQGLLPCCGARLLAVASRVAERRPLGPTSLRSCGVGLVEPVACGIFSD